MVETAEVVIVGGGIVGCAIAFALAKRGVRATIIEKDTVGSGASGLAAGLLNPLDGRDTSGPLEALSIRSFQMHANLVEEVRSEAGVDAQFRTGSYLWVAFDDVEVEGVRWVLQSAQGREGFPSRGLDRQEVMSLEPRVSPLVVEGMSMGGLGQVESNLYTLGLARAAESHGATIRQGAVHGLKGFKGRVTGVMLEGEEVACENVVLAIGPWTGEIERSLGVPMPVEPLKGQILRLESKEPPLAHVLYRAGGGYVASKPDGLIWAGTTEERVGFDDSPTAEARASIMKRTVEIVPDLSKAAMVLQTACLRPASQDGLPILGDVLGWEGVYVATGAGRKGILLAPAMAQAIADLVTTGHTELPIAPLSPGRFVSAAQD